MVGGVALGAVVVALLLGDTTTAHARAGAATLHVGVKAATRTTVAGGEASFVVAVGNTSVGAVAPAPTFTLTESPSLSFEGVSGLTRATANHWSCRSGSAHTVHCFFSTHLAPRLTAVALLRFHVAAGTAAGTTASVTVDGVHAAMRVAAGTPAPSLVADVSGTTSVRVDRPGVETVDVLNVGSGPAASTTLSNLLPPVAGTWTASGSGWHCSRTGGSASCTSSSTVAVGHAAPRLAIHYALDPVRVAALGLKRGGRPSVQTWTVAVNAAGGVATSVPAAVVVEPPPGALLVPAIVAAGGREEVLPGTTTTLQVTVANVGGAATEGRLFVAGTVPAGVGVLQAVGHGAGGGTVQWQCGAGSSAQEFVCSPAAPQPIAPGRATRIDLLVAASQAARPGSGVVAVTAAAENSVDGTRPRAANLPLVVLPGEVGIPALTLRRAVGSASGLRPVVDGSAALLHRGIALAERLDVRNAGGAAIAAGSDAELVQTFGPGVTLRSLREPAGWRCGFGGTAPTLTCALRLSDALAPAAALEGPTVVVVAGAATAGEVSWTATVHLVAPGAPKAYRLPVLVDVERGGPSLVPNFTTGRVPTAGGTGTFGVTVRNEGAAPTVDPVHVGIHVPAGARILRLDDSGWSCATAAQSARCTAPAPTAPHARLSRLHLTLAFAKRTANKTLFLTAHATDGDRPVHPSSSATQVVVPRHALRAVIRAPDRFVYADEPLVRAREALAPTPVTLEGDGSGGSGLGLRYRWRQLSGPAVRWLNQPAATTQPTTADAEFAAPAVTRVTPLAFRLTVADGSATASASVRIRVAPLPAASTGFDFRKAHPHAETSAGPSVERRALPRPARKLKPAAAPKKPKSVATPRIGTVAATTTTATTSPPALPEIFCTLVTDAIAANGSFSASVAGFSLHLKEVHVDGTACDAATTVSFAGSSFGIHTLQAAGVAGTISKDGITFSAGTLQAPEAWNAPSFSVASGSGITIAFASGGTSSASGTIAGSGFGFVPLPSGWSGNTSLSFGAGAVTVHAAASGLHKAAATVDGEIAADGTFSLDVAVQRIVQLEGTAVDVEGHVTRSTPGGALAVSLAGKLDGAVTIVPGLAVDSLNVRAEPTESALGISGSGTIKLSVPSKTLDIAVKFAYDDPSNWSLLAEGVGDASFTPVPGLTLKAKDFKGGIVAKHDAYDLTLHYAQSEAWTPADGVSVSNVALDLSNVCNEVGGACPKDASLFLDVKGDASLSLPSVGALEANVAGSLALPSGEFSVTARLSKPLSIGGGISIDEAALTLSKGMPLPKEEPAIESAGNGGLQVDVHGKVSVPGIGALPTVHASYSDQGWAIAVPLGGFSLPGASGDGSKITGTVLGWASFATSMKVFDAAANDYLSIPIPANGFKLSGAFTTPPWLKEMLKLPGDVTARINGTIDPSTDTYALRMEFSVGGQPYLYGSATSASSIRLKSTFFEVERKGAEFNLALGGTATLAVEGSSSTSASSIDLGVALSYAVSSQTIAGSLTLESKDGWKDAFGANDLTLYGLSVTFQLNLASLVPGLGVAARAILPGNVRSSLGVPSASRTTLVANLSITNPCLGLAVDDPTRSGADVVDVGNGALTAKEFELYVAPAGCTVGTFSYQAGLSLNFDGQVAGVALAIKARLSLAPFAFDGTVDLGEFAVGGMTLKKTHVEVSLSASKLKVAFAGGVEVFGTNVDLSGGLEKTSGGIVADFKGTLDKLALGDVVSATGVKVAAHVETGASSKASFEASGKIALLGSTADATFALSLADGQLNAAKADVKAIVNIGGAGGLSLDGTFKVDYAKGQPLSVDASVAVKAGGFRLASATVAVKPSLLSISADLSVGSVFTARLDGTAYFKDVPSATIALPGGGSATAKAGDFTFSASNVSLNLGGFAATGSVSLGKAGVNAWARAGATMQLLGTGTENSVSVTGSFETNGNFSFSGSADLNLLGFKPKLAVSVAKSGSTVSVSGAAKVEVLGSKVDVNGDFKYDAGQYRFRLAGTGTLAVGGYTLADAKVKLSNFPEDAGFSANVTVGAGSTVTASGRLNIEAGGRFSFAADTSIDLKAFSVNGSVRFANYRQLCVPTIQSFIPFRMGMQCVLTQDTVPTLTASATVDTSGFSFAVSTTVKADGSFSATARTPISGETVNSTGTLDLWVVKGYAEISYHMELTVQSSSSPYVSVDGKGSARVVYAHRTWTGSWSDWDTLAGASLSLKTNPFQACAYASLFGYDVGGCI